MAATPSKKKTRDLGTGAIFYSESKGLYVARIELPPKNGERRRKEITAKTHDKLLEKLRGPMKQFVMNGDIPTGGTTLERYLNYWYETIAVKRVRPNTAKGYNTVLQRFVIPEIGNVRMDKLSPAHLRRVHNRVLSSTKGADKKPLTSTYALNVHLILSTALKDAEREGVIARNPAKLMDAPRKSIPPLEALTVEEAIEVLRLVVTAFETEPYDPAPIRWATYLLTGARRGEILGLEWNRVGETLEFSRQLQVMRDATTAPSDYDYEHIHGSTFWVPPKTDRGRRIVPLVEPLKSMLEIHAQKSPPNKWGLVFTNERGLPINPDRESLAWPKALAASGITDKKVRLHDLRHTTVDLLLEAGVHEDVVMEIVGHSTRATTRGYKSAHALKRRESAMHKLSALLGH